MKNWEADPNDPYCTTPQDLHDAKSISEKLDIPLSVVNFSKEYQNMVFKHFLDEYASGNTPNPDILCNQEIKFKAFLEHALDLKADFIATGHYVNKTYDAKTKEYKLLKGKDKNKDQSYFLYTLNQHQLKHSLFPIGHLEKHEVREIAKKEGFANFDKKDSTGICFIGERNFKKFLSEYLLYQPGNIITTENEILGKHDGLMFYTLGQRKGIGIGGHKKYDEKPWYVAAKNIEKNNLVVTQNKNHPLLLSDKIQSENVKWTNEKDPAFPLKCTAKIRYRTKEQECTIKKENNNYQIKFKHKQWAVTPGQAIVFYKNEECLGGGTIDTTNLP